MKKNIKLLAVMLIAVLSVSMVLTGCSKSSAEPTLQDYVAEHPEVQEEIDKSFAESGLDGTVAIEGNNILMTVDITSLLGEGYELDDATKELFQTSFDSAFDESEANLKESIAGIEEETGIKGVTMQVVVVYSDETVYERTFSAN